MKSNEWNVGYGNQIVNKEGNMRSQSKHHQLWRVHNLN